MLPSFELLPFQLLSLIFPSNSGYSDYLLWGLPNKIRIYRNHFKSMQSVTPAQHLPSLLLEFVCRLGFSSPCSFLGFSSELTYPSAICGYLSIFRQHPQPTPQSGEWRTSKSRGFLWERKSWVPPPDGVHCWWSWPLPERGSTIFLRFCREADGPRSRYCRGWWRAARPRLSEGDIER